MFYDEKYEVIKNTVLFQINSLWKGMRGESPGPQVDFQPCSFEEDVPEEDRDLRDVTEMQGVLKVALKGVEGQLLLGLVDRLTDKMSDHMLAEGTLEFAEDGTPVVEVFVFFQYDRDEPAP